MKRTKEIYKRDSLREKTRKDTIKETNEKDKRDLYKGLFKRENLVCFLEEMKESHSLLLLSLKRLL